MGAQPNRTATKKPHVEKSYEHRSRIQKLGVKPGHRVLLVDVDDDVLRAEIRQAGGHLSARIAGEADTIFMAAEESASLERLGQLQKHLKRDGAIWVIRPKGSAAISEADVMKAGKATGLVDVKVVRFSDTHSALKFVIPVNSR